MREGSLEAPTRHPIAWQDPAFYDPALIEKELERVFDICHGCRRCFNLCDSFPRLFDLVDGSESQELDTVDRKDFKSVVDACTLCDMCFMTKCPYVPPHDFALDFPHLMLRYRAMEHKQGKTPFADKQLAETDRNGVAGWPGRSGRELGDASRQCDRRADTAFQCRAASGCGTADICRPEAGQSGGGIACAKPGRAGVRPQGGAVCDLLRQLQLARGRAATARRAGAQRRGDRGRLSRLLRHAAAGTGPHRRCRRQRAHERRRDEGLDRQGLRRHRPGAVLRADAEIRVAADPAGRCGRENPVARHVRRQRIRRRYRQEGRSCARPVARFRPR